MSGKYEITQYSLWYNSEISEEKLYFPKWFKNGIHLVGDIIDSNGDILTLESMRERFHFNPNILDYYRMKKLLKTFVNNHRKELPLSCSRPFIPLHLQVLHKGLKGCQLFYKIFRSEHLKMPNCTLKWSEILRFGYTDPKRVWGFIFKACFKSVVDNQIVWFQYKIINNILNTNQYLHRIKLRSDNICSLCQVSPEDILHMFVQCSEVRVLWNNIENWIKMKLNITLKMDTTMKTIGYCNYDEHFWPLNFVLILSRFYIYQISKKKSTLNIFSLQNIIKERFHQEKYLAQLSGNGNLFQKRWEIWQHLFTDGNQ